MKSLLACSFMALFMVSSAAWAEEFRAQGSEGAALERLLKIAGAPSGEAEDVRCELGEGVKSGSCLMRSDSRLHSLQGAEAAELFELLEGVTGIEHRHEGDKAIIEADSVACSKGECWVSAHID